MRGKLYTVVHLFHPGEPPVFLCQSQKVEAKNRPASADWHFSERDALKQDEALIQRMDPLDRAALLGHSERYILVDIRRNVPAERMSGDSPVIHWDENPEGGDFCEDFCGGSEPASFTPEQIQQGSACGEGGCE